MFGKCQIVPALASAVHGAIEELPHIPESPSPQLDRSRLASSSTSSTTSPALINTDKRLSNTYNSRATSQLDARRAFTYFDKNHDGKLTIKEFKSVMHDLGYKTVDKRFIKQMFAEANRNGNGRTLSFEEFVEFLEIKITCPSSTTTTTTNNNV